MSKERKASTEKDYAELGYEVPVTDSVKKTPNWVNLVQLDGPLDDSLASKLAYKPALRFHGLGGGLWGQGLSDAPSVTSESKPPSYRFVESLKARESCSTCDQGSTYNATSISAVSPLTLRRRNTVAVVLVAIALLAAIAAITGLILHFLHPKAMLRANVRFTIANHNFTQDMVSNGSAEFKAVSRPLCKEMDNYFLTSELADFYLGCQVVSLRDDQSKEGIAVHHTLDFMENKVTNSGDKIREIILRKSGRLKTDDTLYLVIGDFNVYLRSLKIDLERLPLPAGHPNKLQPRIPWNDDFIPSKSDNAFNVNSGDKVLTHAPELTNSLSPKANNSFSTENGIPRKVLPELSNQKRTKKINLVDGIQNFQGKNQFDAVSDPYSNKKPIESTGHAILNVVSSLSVASVVSEALTITPTTSSMFHAFATDLVDVANIISDNQIKVEHFNSKRNIGGKINDRKTSTSSNQDKRLGKQHNFDLNNGFGVPLEASFSEVDQNIGFSTTPDLDDLQTQSKIVFRGIKKADSKIFKIATDAFLIRGTNSPFVLNPDYITETFITSSSVSMSVQFDSTDKSNNNNNNNNNNNEKSSLIPKDFIHLPVDSRPKADIVPLYMSIPKLLIKTVTPVQVHYSTAPELKEYPGRLILQDKTPLIKIKNSNSTNQNGIRSSPPELKEVVDLPVKESLIADGSIEWVNIFNNPKDTVNMSVGDIAGILDPNRPVFNLQPVPIRQISNKIPRAHTSSPDGFVAASPNVSVIDSPQSINAGLTDNHLQNVMTFLDSLMGDNSVAGPALRKAPQTTISPQLTGRNNGIQPGYYSDQLESTINMMNNIRDMTAMVNRRSMEHIGSMVSGQSRMSDQSTQSSLTTKHILKSPATPPTNNLLNPNPKFQFRAGLYAGRPAFIVSKTSDSRQPWAFLRRMDDNTRKINAFGSNNRRNRLPLNDYTHGGHISRLYLVHNGAQGYDLNRVIRWKNPARQSISTRLFQLQLPSLQQSSFTNGEMGAFTSRVLTRNARELPGFGEFADLARMKDILVDLVSNMKNMTDKVDKMQAAINIINKTFHETKEPMFKLEETLSNMTTSLGNLRQNLNTVNETLKSFREFLKKFDNTVFDIDDVLNNIDDTLTNLGNAASFVELSVADLNQTTRRVNGELGDINAALNFVNKSVFDVSYTSAYSNETLDGMRETLKSLESAVQSINKKVEDVIGGSDVITVSLKDINSTVINTYEKLFKLHDKLTEFNKKMSNVSSTVTNLNGTYNKLNETLDKLNEPRIFVNGTVLEVIQKLSNIENKMVELNRSVIVFKGNMTDMNKTLLFSMDWINDMDGVLSDLNVKVNNKTNVISIDLESRNVIKTIGTLIQMNGTLSDIGNEVIGINLELDKMDTKLGEFGRKLSDLIKTLDNITLAFKILNNTLETVNNTVNGTNLSLDVMTDNVQSIRLSAIEMKIPFENINETLNVVNSTVLAVNVTARDAIGKLHELNQTFKELIQSSQSEEIVARRLMQSLNGFKGPTMELNKKLYNANETLRLVRSKGDIIEESYRILNNTLENTKTILKELFVKLNSTENSMNKTSKSLQSVNTSLSAMEDSYKNISENLAQLIKSYETLNVSLNNVGPAFPNMMNSIMETQLNMDTLLRYTVDLKRNLTVNTHVRNGLYRRYLNLDKDVYLTTEFVKNISTFLCHVMNQSKTAFPGINKLTKAIQETSVLYKTLEEKVEFINKTHDKLYNKYLSLKDKQTYSELNLANILSITKQKKAKLGSLVKLQENYTNLDIPLNETQNRLLEKLNAFDAVVREYNVSKENFENIDLRLWDEKGYPKAVHYTIGVLVNETNMVNDTLHQYASAIRSLNENIHLISELFEEADDVIIKTIKLQNYADEIDTNHENITRKAIEISNSVKENHQRVKQIAESLRQQLNEVIKMRDHFGNVSGTFMNVTVYEDLSNNITDELNMINDILKAVEQSDKDFSLALQHYNGSMNTYKGSAFNTSKDSEDLLKFIQSVIKATDRLITDVESKMEKVHLQLNIKRETLSDIANKVKSLATDLQTRKQKHDYVEANQERILSDFVNTISEVNLTISNLSVVYEKIREIKDIGETVRARSNSHPLQRFFINIDEEINFAETAEQKLKSIEDKAKDLRGKLSAGYNILRSIEESKLSLNEIEEKYQKFERDIGIFRITLSTFNQSGTEIDTELSAILATFEDLVDLLTYAEETYNDIQKGRSSVEALRNNITTTAIKLLDAEEQLYLLNDKFRHLKQKYTNFTETDIDLAKSYVNEALRDNIILLQNLSTELSTVNSSAEETYFLYDKTRDKISKTMLDRHNTTTFIQNEIIPQYTQTMSNVESINIKLADILSKLDALELVIHSINETVHISNKQLFADRQKKLLAETHLTELQKSQQLISRSIDKLDSLLRNVTQALNDAVSNYEILKDKLVLFPSVNISLEAVGEKLSQFKDLQKAFKERIQTEKDRLFQTSNTLMISSSGYSDNETVEEVQSRFRSVREMLNNITEGVSILDSDLSWMQNETNDIKTELANGITSLKEMQQVDTLFRDLGSDVSRQNAKFDDRNKVMDDIIFNISAMEAGLDYVRQRFRMIDSSTFDKNFNPFSDTLKKANKDLSALTTKIDGISSHIKDAKGYMNQFELLQNTSVSTHQGLVDRLALKKSILLNLTDLRDQIDNGLLSALNESTSVSKTTSDLENGLNEMKSLFTRQEKEEYFTSKFPGHRYKTLKRKLEDLSQFLTDKINISNSLEARYEDLKENISKASNIEFNLQPLNETITSIQGSLYEKELSFNRIQAGYDMAASLLNAEDGYPISNNETIEEMKARYNKMEKILRKVTERADNIKNKIHNDTKELTRTNASITFISSLLQQFGERRNDLYNVNNATIALFQDVLIAADDSENRTKSLENLVDTYNELLKDFNTTSNERIETFKTEINNRLRRIEPDVRKLQSTSQSEKKNISMLLENLRNFTTLISETHNDSSDLENLLKEIGNGLMNVTNKTDHARIVSSLIEKRGKENDHTLISLGEDINNLRNLLVRQEKIDFIENSRFRLLLELESLLDIKQRTNESLCNASETFEYFKEMLLLTDNALQNVSQINISLVSAFENETAFSNVLLRVHSEFQIAKDSLHRLNASILNIESQFYNESTNISELKDTHLMLDKTIQDLNESFWKLLSDLEVKSEIHKNINSLNDISQSVEAFKDANKQSAGLKSKLSNLKGNISDTEEALGELKEKTAGQIARLDNITENFGDISTVQTKELVKEINEILNDMKIKLPFSENIFNKRMLNTYDDVNRGFDRTLSFFNLTYNTPVELKKHIAVIVESFTNFTLDVNKLKDDNHFFKAEMEAYAQLLERADTLLDELENQVIKQRKFDILNTSLDVFNKLKVISLSELNLLNKDLYDAGQDVIRLENSRILLAEKMNSLPTVNISTYPQKERIVFSNNTIADTLNSISVINESLINMDIFLLDLIQIIENTSVSVKDVELLVENANKTVQLAENKIANITSEAAYVKGNISTVEIEIEDLNKTINWLTSVKQNIELHQTDIKNVNMLEKLVQKELFRSNDTLLGLHLTLKQLQQEYNESRYNTSMLESPLKVIKTGLVELSSDFNEASAELVQVNSNADAINDRLLKVSKSRLDLQKSLDIVNNTLQLHKDLLIKANNTLSSILHSIPELNLNLNETAVNVTEFNETLKEERSKLVYQQRELPVLESQYVRLNLSFDLTNTTLQKLSDEIELMKHAVNTLKERLVKYETVNISTTDLHNNLTHLDDRLAIMQDSYRNVEEVLTNLRYEIENSSVIGKNISLNDIEERFTSFNNSIVMSETVLARIESESFEMANHLDVLNDTVVAVNNGLDRLTDRRELTKGLSANITSLRGKVGNTTSNLTDIENILKNLSDSFQTLQQKYKAVFNKTTENSMMLRTLINKTEDTVHDVNLRMNDIQLALNESANNVGIMNNTLFKNIKTYTDLTDTLKDVKGMYAEIVDSLKILKDGVTGAQLNTTAINPAVDKIAQMLHNLSGDLNIEQLKHDFLQDNIGSLHEKLTHLGPPSDLAKRRLNNTYLDVNNTFTMLTDLVDKLNTHQNVDISLNSNLSEIKDIRRNIINFANQLQNITEILPVLHKNMSSLVDSPDNVSELRTRYQFINESVDKMIESLKSIHDFVQEANHNLRNLSEAAYNLDQNLQEHSAVNASTFDYLIRVNKLGTDLTNTSRLLLKANSSFLDLLGQAGQMKRMYNSLNNTVLQNDLSAVIENTKLGLENLKDLQNQHSRLSEETTNTNASVVRSLEDINQEIRSEKELTDMLLRANANLSNFANQSNILENDHSSLVSAINALTSMFKTLTQDVRFLNKSFNEEDAKRSFMEQNMPLFLKQINDIYQEVNVSNSAILKVGQNIAETESKLTALQKRMDAIEEIQIPLHDEFNQLNVMKEGINRSKEWYYNLTRLLDSIDANQIGKTNVSLSELKSIYKNMSDNIQSVRKDLLQLNRDAQGIAETAVHVDDSVKDINSTIDHFLAVNEKLEITKKKNNKFLKQMTNSSDGIIEISTDLQDLEQKLNEVARAYTHINGTNLANNKSYLDRLIKDSKENFIALRQLFDKLKRNGSKTETEISNMNATLLSTKQLLSDLNTHISKVESSLADTEINLGKMNSTHENLKTNMTELSDQLKDILKEIEKLQGSYVTENEKQEYVFNNKPGLEKRFADLQDILESTNRNLSMTEARVADVKYAINLQGEELRKFITLNITTAPEEQTWKEMFNHTDMLFKLFSNISGKYSDIQGEINTFSQGNITTLKTKHEKIDLVLSNIENKTKWINDELNKITEQSSRTIATLEQLAQTMDKMRFLQAKATNSKSALTKANSTAFDINRKLSIVENTIKYVIETLSAIKEKYTVLRPKTLKLIFSELESKIGTRQNKHSEVKTNFDKLQQSLLAMMSLYDKTFKQLVESKLSRENAEERILDMTSKMTDVETGMKSYVPKFTNITNEVEVENNIMARLKTEVDGLNKSLHEELQKYLFVKQHLPPTQGRYNEVNNSFHANLPEVNKMKSQIKNLIEIISKIKEKMSLFGMQDIDSSVQKWDSMIKKLNDTMRSTITNSKQSENKLSELKEELWRNGTNYSKNESLNQLRMRFDAYNKSLDSINSSTHTIGVKLGNLQTETSDLTVALVERDSILTTTPATTTPSGPPEWLTFISSGIGTVGKDSGFVRCSVGNTQDWKIMKITKLETNGKETAVAAWMVGKGARKAIRDRRISVSKTSDSTGGGTLQVEIKSLQCEDAGIYLCSIDTYDMWPLEAEINITTSPEDNLKPEFPTEVFEDKVANFSCTGHPGYPNGRITWTVKRQNEAAFKPFTFYSARPTVSDKDCVRTEINKVEYQFDMSWNNTQIRCYIENTDFYAEGVIRLLPYDICNRVRYLGTVGHPYTPHKYIVCGKELNIMECPGNTCYDEQEENCVQCKASHSNGDPCFGKPLFSYVPHEKDCKKYYICMGPTKTAKKCAKGYFQPNIPGNCVTSYAQSHCGQKKG